MADDNIFDPNELERINELLNEFEQVPLEDAEVECTITIPCIHIFEILYALKEISCFNDGIIKTFCLEIGSSISREYMTSNIEYDEPLADLCQWFMPQV